MPEIKRVDHPQRAGLVLRAGNAMVNARQAAEIVGQTLICTHFEKSLADSDLPQRGI